MVKSYAGIHGEKGKNTMALDGITVAGIVSELNTLLSGARITKIAQPEPNEIIISTKGARRKVIEDMVASGAMKRENAEKAASAAGRLLLSASSSLPLIYFSTENKLSPMTAPNFCMLLRKHIGSGKIVSVSQPGLERVIIFEIEHYDELGDLCRKKLILELMGKYSNLIFTDEHGVIIDAIKRIGAQTSSVREVLPGRDYFIPKTQDKADPLQTDEEEFRKTIFSKPLPLGKAIYSSYTGLSPVFAEELCYRASLESEKSAREIPESAQIHLYRIFSDMILDVKEQRFLPNIVYDSEGVPVEFAAFELTIYRDLTVRQFPGMSDVLETYYSEKNDRERIRQRSQDLRRIVTTALERESKKLDLQRRQLLDTDKREKYRVRGELLNTYGYSAEPGAKSITVENYYDDNREITIPLDETLTAQENAQKYFDRYGKLKRTYEALTQLIKETEAEVEELDSVKTFLDQAKSEADLNQIREELILSGFIKKKGPSAKKGQSRPEQSRPWHYRTKEGFDIYVGKNNLQNDELTFHMASNSDWWFHAKKIPGSHVVVKAQGKELPDSVFEDAAALAAYYSKNRASTKVEVDYVQKREVKKPNGAKPGFVVYYTNYSMVARPDISGVTLVE